MSSYIRGDGSAVGYYSFVGRYPSNGSGYHNMRNAFGECKAMRAQRIKPGVNKSTLPRSVRGNEDNLRLANVSANGTELNSSVEGFTQRHTRRSKPRTRVSYGGK